MTHLYEAKELKQKFPMETKGFTVWQVRDIWEEYSDSMAAGWMMPDEESVKRVFEDYRIET
jgi:hypothetical protein